MLLTALPISLLLAILRISVFVSMFPSLRGEFRLTALIVGFTIGVGLWSQDLSGWSEVGMRAVVDVGAESGFVENPPLLRILILLFQEALIGVVVAIPFVCVIEFIGAIGRFADLLRGVLDAEITLPNIEQRTSPIETIFRIGAMSWIFIVGAHHQALSFLLTIPTQNEVGFGRSKLTNAKISELLNNSLSIVSDAFALIISEMLPVLATIALFYLVLLSVGRLVPRMNLAQEARALVLLIGLTALAGTLRVARPERLDWGFGRFEAKLSARDNLGTNGNKTSLDQGR